MPDSGALPGQSNRRMPLRHGSLYVGYGRYVRIPLGSPQRNLTDDELAEAHYRIARARRAIQMRRRGLTRLTGDERQELADIENELWTPSGGARG